MVVAGDNFSNPNVLIMVLVEAIVMMVILLPVAGEFGKRQTGATPATPGADKI